MGLGLTGKTIALVGAGGIGMEIIPLALAFDMNVIAADPYADPEVIRARGATPMPLEQALGVADFIVITCLLNEETRHLINAKRLSLVRPSAYLINVARGPVVDERALIEALSAGRLAGAGLDVFEQEPISSDNPLLGMDNVIVSPHALCWTDENFGGIARSGLQSIVDFLMHRQPMHVVNRDALDHPQARSWLVN
jgi:phosphoglycerate dehydrogenase-like enzyme